MNDRCVITGVKSDGQGQPTPAGLTFDAHSENALATLEEYHDRARRLVEKRGAEGRTLSRKHLAAFKRLADHLLDLIGPEAKDDAPEACESKGATPYVDTPIVSDPWDADAAREKIKAWADGDMAKYREGFAWYDSAKPDEMGSYKLPIRDVHAGKLVTNIHAVSAALAAVDGARGGVDIPEADKAKVAAMLGRYRKAAGVGEDDQGQGKGRSDAPETKDATPAPADVATPEASITPEAKSDPAEETASPADPAIPATDVAPAPTPEADPVAAPDPQVPEADASTKSADATPVATPDAGTPAEAAPGDEGAASPPPAPPLVDATDLFAAFQATLAKSHLAGL